MYCTKLSILAGSQCIELNWGSKEAKADVETKYIENTVNVIQEIFPMF